MTKPTTFAIELMLAVLATMALVLLSAEPVAAQAAEGNNAVYNSSTLAGSPAFIDASVFFDTDICKTINDILTGPNYPGMGAVVDARGILPSQTPGPQICASNPFSSVTVPSVVLLPASTICLETPWTLPENTRIIGEGGTNTRLRACATNACGMGTADVCHGNTFSGSDMVDMGTSSCTGTSPCSGISVEHLELDGEALSVNGIVNSFAQESSYVNDVSISDTLGTGISIQPGATGSGPYSSILFQCPSCSDTTHSICVSIQATTRGLHGITCVAKSDQSNTSGYAIALDANSNSIKDVHIEGFYDGVLIGSRGNAQGNTLLNIYAGDGINGPVFNAVHICKPNHMSTNCPNNSGAVTDLGLFQIENIGTGKPPAFQAATILDDLTSTQVNYTQSNSYVGMYIIGNNNQVSNGYSRFTTAPSCNLYTNSPSCVGGIPTFVVGGSTPGTACSTPGVVYSNTMGTKNSNNTIFVCKGGTWKAVTM